MTDTKNEDFFDEYGDPRPKTEAVYDILYRALSPNFEIDSEGYFTAAIAVLESEWLRQERASAFELGVGIAGRYGHEDNWDSYDSPYHRNPWRTREELEAQGCEV
ncbi:hypothetical protein SEA_CECE_53 [Microbacterium phage Cece]|nr:hypothetical protein SEA_CECE_53 [Microbacterium phage Cece]